MTEMITKLPHTLSDRQPKGSQVLLLGLLAGAFAFVLAEMLTPSSVSTAAAHDLALTQRLALIFTPLVALWLGWLQGSKRCALIGAGAGLGIGILCFGLGGALSPRAVMFLFPSLIGGILAASCGSCVDDTFRRVSARFAKGLTAGLMMAWASLILFRIGSVALWPTSGNIDYMDAYSRMMWRVGPIAFGVSAALFFLLMRWAAGLDRPIESREARRPRRTEPLPPLSA